MTPTELKHPTLPVRVTLDAIGEGPNGDNAPGEPSLVRFYVETYDGQEWTDAPDASYCTTVPETASPDTLAALAAAVLQATAEPAARGESVKHAAARLSWWPQHQERAR